MFTDGWDRITSGVELCLPFALELLFGATLILLSATLLNLTLRSASAALRHRLWALSMVGLLILPLCSPFLPKLPLPVNIPLARTQSLPPKVERASPLATPVAMQSDTAAPFIVQPAMPRTNHPSLSPPSLPFRTEKVAQINSAPSTSPLEERPRGDSPSLWLSLVSALMLFWLLGIAWGLTATVRSIWLGRYLVRDSGSLADPSWRTLFDELMGQLKVHRRVTLGIGMLNLVPLSVGFWKPRILLPTDCGSWTLEKRRAVLVHELSHIARNDVFWQFATRLACVFYWIHPLTWLAVRRIRIERERACDDAVLLLGSQPDQYATILLEVAATLRNRSQHGTGAVAMACRKSVEQRIRAILQPGLCRLPVQPRMARLMLCAGIIFAATTAALHPFAPAQQIQANGAIVSSNQDTQKNSLEITTAKNNQAKTAVSAEKSPSSTSIATKKALTEPAPILLSAKGTVLDETGKPITGAKVYLREWSTYRISTDPWERHPKDVLAEVQTDASGAFDFQDIPAKPLHNEWIRLNPWDIVVTAPGYAIAWQHLDAPKVLEPIVVKLSPEAKITGKLVDENGRPVEGIEVKVMDIAALGIGESFQSVQKLDLQASQLCPTAKTDAEGSVILGGLPQNYRLMLFVEDDHYRPEMIYVATTDQLQPGIVDRTWDPEGKSTTRNYKVFSHDFSQQLKPPYPRIVGQVTAADTGKPMPHVKISASWKNFRYEVIADEKGNFVIKQLSLSKCMLHVSPPEKTDYLAWNEPLVISQDQKELAVNVQLPVGQEVRGQVTDESTGQGASGIYLLFHSDTADKAGSKGYSQAPSVTTDADGKFRLLVPPEKGIVALTQLGEPGARGYDIPYFKEGSKNQDARYSKEIEVVTGKPAPEVKFTIPSIRPGDGPFFYASLPIRPTVEGQAVDADGKPVAGAEVGLKLWFTEKENALRIARTDENGRFTLRNIPTNNHAEIKIVHRDRKLCGYTRVPAEEKVATNEKPLEIKLSPTGSISGRVMEGDKPIPGANVSVSNTLIGEKSVNFEGVRTDANGRFEFLQLPADQSVRVHVFFAEFNHTTTAGAGIGDSQQVQLKPGENLELKPFQFVRANLSIAGIVVDLDGKPVEGATVSVEASFPGHGAFTQKPTGKDGRFTISNIPNVQLKVMAYIRPTENSPDNRIRSSARVDARPGQQDVEIVLDPKLVRGKK